MSLYSTIPEPTIVSYVHLVLIVRRSVITVNTELVKASVVSAITVVRIALDPILTNVLAA
jgi:hypothetical protein